MGSTGAGSKAQGRRQPVASQRGGAERRRAEQRSRGPAGRVTRGASTVGAQAGGRAAAVAAGTGREPPSRGREESGAESRSTGVTSLRQQGAGKVASDVGRGYPRAGGGGQGSRGGAVAAHGCVNGGGA
ncbi:hypothetical protein U9M48_039085 [Paspalum notatum var. saurae]|uniref:Uncharacterized protein n=1 Tax=Paspalum notatum var. saurae TaxID=547442 RepID=A0AAQ3XE86_PASNO